MDHLCGSGAVPGPAAAKLAGQVHEHFGSARLRNLPFWERSLSNHISRFLCSLTLILKRPSGIYPYLPDVHLIPTVAALHP